MSLARDRCICLRKFEYSETSQILTLFGRRTGVVRVIAQGAHRVTKTGASKFGGGIDLLDIGEAVFTDRPERDLATLTEWHLREGHLELRRSLRGLYLGFYAAELTSLLMQERDPHPNLFDALERCCAELPTPRTEQAFLAFELELIREIGLLPQLESCVSCGTAIDAWGLVGFDPGHGGVVCRRCEGSFPQRSSLDSRLVGVIKYVLSISASNGTKRLPSLTRHQSDPINRLLADHLQYTLGRRMKMPRWVCGAQSSITNAMAT